MQKTNRLALAVLALLGSTAAFAQSSVTLYGRVNTTVERQEVGNVKTTGLFNNSSRFGFKGTEDLGGGLSALFAIESFMLGELDRTRGIVAELERSDDVHWWVHAAAGLLGRLPWIGYPFPDS